MDANAVLVDIVEQREPGKPGRPARSRISSPVLRKLLANRVSPLYERYAQRQRMLPPYVDKVEQQFPRIYDEMEETNPQVASGAETLSLLTVSHPMGVLPGGAMEGEVGYEQAKRNEVFITENIRRVRQPFMEALFQLDASAFRRGHKLAEIEIELAPLEPGGKPMYLLKGIKPKPYDVYGIMVDAFNDLLCYVPKRWNTRYNWYNVGTLEDVPSDDRLNPRKFLHLVNHPVDGNWLGTSGYRNIYHMWWQVQQIMAGLTPFLATCLQPAPIYKQGPNTPKKFRVTDPDTGTEEEVDSLEYHAGIAEDFHNGSPIAVADGEDLELRESKSKGEAFVRFIELFNYLISMSLTLQSLATGQAVYQPKASSDNHKDMLVLKPRYRKMMLAHLLETGLFQLLLELNFRDFDPRYTPIADLGQSEVWNLRGDGTAFGQMESNRLVFPSQKKALHQRLGMPLAANAEYELHAKAWAAEQERLINPPEPPAATTVARKSSTK